ncbi:MAG: Ig-like domain-containing protein, partial [Thermoplasmata archaeon]
VSSGKIQYTLNVSVQSTPFVDDHNNEFENATPVYQTTNFTNLTVGPDDLLDYYVYHAEQNDNISLRLYALDCDYDLYIVTKQTSGYPLYSIKAASIIANPSKTSESINYTVPSAGDYYFVVKYYSHQVPNKPYRLEVYVPTHNLPPTINSFTPSNTVVDMLPGQTQTFTVTATDTSPLTYKWYVGGIEQIGENTNSFNYVAGEYPTTVKCVVRDDTTGVSSVTWTIRIDPKPIIRTSTPSQNEVSIPVDGQVVFSVDADDTNQLGEVTTASLTYNWSVSQSGNLVGYLGTSTSVVINHTTSTLVKGNYVLSVKITDTAGQFVYRNWTVTVPNHPPKYIGSTTTATCNEDTNTTLTGIKAQFVDIDGDSVTLSVTGGAGVDAEFVGNDLKIIPKPNWYGVENITVSATDGTDSVSVMIRVTVTNVNDAPIPKTNLPTISFTEDTSYSIGIDQFFTDPEGSAVMIHSVTADVGQVTVTKNGTNIDIVPAANYFGTFNLTIVATDGTAQSDMLRVPVTVTGVNDAPTVSITNPSNGFKTTAGKKITFDCTANDPDGDTLTFRWLDGTKEISTTQKFDKSLSAGKHTIRVYASDGKIQADSSEVVITVSEQKSPGFEAIFVVILLGAAALLFMARRM